VGPAALKYIDAAMLPSVSVVIPAYNEEEYVERTLTAVTAALERAGIEHEIVLVNDASTDRTAALAAAAAAADPRVRVIHNPQNLTLGGSLRAGFAAAGKELVLYTDADLPFDLEEVPRAVRLLQVQEADMLVAYRFDRTAEGTRRALYTWGYSVIIRALFGLKIRDVNFAFKLFRRSLLDRFVLKSGGSFIDAELVVRTLKAGGQIIQIGVDYFPRTRGESKLASGKVIVRILSELTSLWRELRSARP
jgi:glycosyltransferase involved in cell wall biosynthesis